jgi:hypothetical protein
MHANDAQGVTPLILTDHARKRVQSRGISIRILEVVYVNAHRSPFVGSVCRSLTVSRRRPARLADSIPAADRERMVGVVLVVDPKSNEIITVLHGHSPSGRRYRRQCDGRRIAHVGDGRVGIIRGAARLSDQMTQPLSNTPVGFALLTPPRAGRCLPHGSI